MRRQIITMIAALAAFTAVEMAEAQVRVRPGLAIGFDGAELAQQQQPRTRGLRMRIPPSAAIQQAMQAVPGAKPLGVRLRGGTYIVRLKSSGKVVRVGVDAATGAVTSIP